MPMMDQSQAQQMMFDQGQSSIMHGGMQQQANFQNSIMPFNQTPQMYFGYNQNQSQMFSQPWQMMSQPGVNFDVQNNKVRASQQSQMQNEDVQNQNKLGKFAHPEFNQSQILASQFNQDTCFSVADYLGVNLNEEQQMQMQQPMVD